MLTVPSINEHADQRLPEETMARAADMVRINLTPLHYRATLDQSDTQFLDFTYPPPPFFLLSPIFDITTKSDHISEQLETTWNIKVSRPTPTSFFFFQMTGEGSRHWLKLACTGACWPTLSEEWCWLSGCQVIEDCQSDFKWPLFSFLLLFHAPLLSILLSPCHCLFSFHPLSLFISLSLSTCLYLLLLTLLIWWRERSNSWLALENTLVTTMCVFLVCEYPQRVGLS